MTYFVDLRYTISVFGGWDGLVEQGNILTYWHKLEPACLNTLTYWRKPELVCPNTLTYFHKPEPVCSNTLTDLHKRESVCPDTLRYCRKWKLACPNTLMFLDWLILCPIGNNSFSLDKELFLFRAKRKTRYSERERKETLEDKPDKHFWLGCFVNWSKMSVSANRAADGLSDKSEIITN